VTTWLHDPEIFASLAEGDAGPARDWATTRLALYAPDRFAVWPDDDRCHDVLLAAAPHRAVDGLIHALQTRKPCPETLANAAAALSAYGLLPEDPSPLIHALRGALRKDGDNADIWLAFALSQLQAVDAACLAAAAKGRDQALDWVLPVLVLRVAEQQNALDEAAREIAADLRKAATRDPNRLFSLLTALGAPLDALARSYKEIEEAVAAGATVAHRDPMPLRLKPGGQRRRQQDAVQQLLAGVAGPMAALLRAVYAAEPPAQWSLWGVATAAWLHGRATPAADRSDPVADVLKHGAGRDVRILAAARRAIRPEQRPEVLRGLDEGGETASVILALELLRQNPDDAELAERILDQHGGRLDTDIRTAALACVAATKRPEPIPAWLRSGDSRKRILGLLCAEWVPTAEVLQALLEIPVPAEEQLRVQYARCLAAMGDPATLGHLAALRAGDEEGRMDEAMTLAEELLRVKIPAGGDVSPSEG
jgi:hypothetical protein